MNLIIKEIIRTEANGLTIKQRSNFITYLQQVRFMELIQKLYAILLPYRSLVVYIGQTCTKFNNHRLKQNQKLSPTKLVKLFCVVDT